MNNTSRFKTYGIIAVLLLVSAGVVWFYSSRNASGKSHIARKPVPNKQVNRSSQQSGTTNAQQADPLDTLLLEEAKYQTRGFGWGQFVFPLIGKELDLTPNQETQLKDTLDALRSHVVEMLVNTASYQETDDCTIVIKTGLSQSQTKEVENLLYEGLRDIIGDDKLQSLDERLDKGIRDYISLLGSSDRQYTVTGLNIDDIRKGKKTEQSLKTAEAFFVKERSNLSDGELKAFHEGVWTITSKDSFIEKFGKIATATLNMISETNN